jgi:RNA polymerase sigma-70 factor (ECF subfamily)
MNKTKSLAVANGWVATDARADAPERTAAREPDEQVALYFRQYAEILYRDLTGYCGCEEDAEEITQEAFLRLYEALAAGEPIDRPDAWVFTVARRLMLDRFKQRRYDEAKYREFGRFVAKLMHSFQAPDAALADRQRHEALRTALKELPPLERQMLFARAEGQKLRQIGEQAGMDGRRVSEVLTRAIKTLQRLCE